MDWPNFSPKDATERAIAKIAERVKASGGRPAGLCMPTLLLFESKTARDAGRSVTVEANTTGCGHAAKIELPYGDNPRADPALLCLGCDRMDLMPRFGG